jgi:hypothetical protein
MTRTAISPRLAIRIFFNTAYYLYLMNTLSPNQPENTSSWPNGWWVSVVAETGSTNTDLLASAHGGAEHHSVLMAKFQSAGKGRLDRTWVAEPGSNLLVSLLFRFADTMVRPTHQFTQIVGMAAALASEQLVAVKPQMKWPNDLLIDGKKVSGILAQGAADFVVVGIGVNVGWAPPDAVSLNAFVARDTGQMLKEAVAADASGASRNAAKLLAGIPIAFKDNINTTGLPTTGCTGALK